jgi:hypothetical protein
MYRLFVTTDFAGVLKRHFGELKMLFSLTAQIELVWYILNFLGFGG